MITLSMIVKNEEKHLRECLESVKGVVDEIILVDTGSTDNTVKIAKEFGAKVFHFNWINDFSAARNFSLEHSKGDWILYLDADERLAQNSITELKKLTSANKTNAYYCQVISINEVNNTPSLMSYVRLFPNDKRIRFEGAVHEQIEYALLKNNFKINNSGIEILHVGYNLDSDGLKKKAARNLEILLNENKKNNTSYYSFQLGQTYGILNERESAVKYFKLALQDSLLKREYKSTALRYIAIYHAEKQEWNDAVENINQSIRHDDRQPLALLTAAKIYVKLANPEYAENFCMRAYQVNNEFLRKKSSSGQVILLNEKDFLNHALEISVQTRNIKLFNFFYDKLKLLNTNMPGTDNHEEMNLFDILLNNKKFEEKEIDRFTNVVNKSNLELVLALIEKYNLLETKILFLNNLSEKFPDDSNIMNRLGVAFAASGRYTDSELMLEKSHEINPNDASTVFFLISTYLQKNNPLKIISLLNEAEKKFSQMPAILNKLNLVRQKLNLPSKI